MNVIDLVFPVVGSRLPTDHAYPLYSSLTHRLQCLHDGSVPFRLSPVSGQYVGDGLLRVDPSFSQMRLRIAVEHIPQVLPLAGKTLKVMGQRICLGVPRIYALTPSSELYAHSVTYKNAEEPEPFLEATRKQLDLLGVRGVPKVPEHIAKGGRREPYRHVIRVKEAHVICFALLVEGLNPDESLRLQEQGIGGRRHMGGGMFVPAREEGHHVE